ncbi:MAG: hypothetical protein WC710_14955 [Gallionella sp.]|jgi:DNA mismatch repair ATPase MutS
MTKAVAADLQETHDAEMEAAFAAASVPDTKEPIAEPAKAEEQQPAIEVKDAEPKIEAKVEEPKQEEPKPALSEDQLKLLSAVPKLEQLLARVDKVDGNYGEIKRLLESTKQAAATQKSAAAFESSGEADYLDREFEEIAQGVQEKIDRAIAKVPAGMNEEQLQAWYEKRKAADYQESVKILDTAHPDRIEIRESPEYKEWLASMPAYKQHAFLNSEDPYYVSSKLSEFKEYRDNKASAAEKSKQRIENAVTPAGVKPKGQSTITDEEAAQKAFEAQFS